MTVCLWYDHNAEYAAKFYAQTFPGSSVGVVRRAPGAGGEAAKRAFAAMMTMKKIDVAAIEAAVHADA
jgi:predicted 3-demethylubiquinone-9 3-methyltransferase (glyoxalase superfamily)